MISDQATEKTINIKILIGIFIIFLINIFGLSHMFALCHAKKHQDVMKSIQRVYAAVLSLLLPKGVQQLP